MKNKKDTTLNTQPTRDYQELANMPIDGIFTTFTSSIKGLTPKEAEINRDKFGKNKVTEQRSKSLVRHLFESFINPFTIILLILAIVSVVTDIIIPIYRSDLQEADPITVIIIVAMVLISGILRFIQEARSGDAASRLLDMITTTVAVKRDGETFEEIPLDEVVVGDIVYLAVGDMIPADIRIIEAKDFFVGQSSLTGESEPVEKTPDIPKNVDTPTEMENISFMGTTVISGSAIAIVISTGDRTIFGSMTKAISKEATETSFTTGVNAVSWVLIRFMLIMVPVVFFVNGITKGDWVSAFLFAISVAVGLTPEMLPMIVTASLAKGAMSMSEKKTIVKNLNSIQNFGAMDILCTDKTGTITQDKVALVYHMDIQGNEDSRVLGYAFLNSHYQTGYKNLMDIAIIDKTEEAAEKQPPLKDLSSIFKKVDEIPFDFNRRRLSVVVEDINGKTQLITKGAVEEMLSISTHAEYNKEVLPLTDELKQEIINITDELNEDGMRVIAVAHKKNPPPVDHLHVKDEADMILIGYLAFLDPPKESTEKAIIDLKEHGVSTKVLTGDNDKVTRTICRQVGLSVENLLLGSDIEKMSEQELSIAVEETSVFAKLDPSQKVRVVTKLRDNGHVVGFLGDGINDSAAMKASDIGISVDTAVDIAKESADIILLEKNLAVLGVGVIEGRKTYANMIKYIKMTASSNFGNMFSVLAASALLPFLPMMSVHLIFLNLIYDLSCTAIPWDNVDPEYLKKPRTWNATSISSFMIWLGPTSSIFDWTTYLFLYFILCPLFVSGGLLFKDIPVDMVINSGFFSGLNMRETYISMFQAGWFIESMWSQTLVIHMIRTPKIPFIQSRAAAPVTLLTFTGIIVATIIPYTLFGDKLGFVPLPGVFFIYLIICIVLYMILATNIKNAYIRRYGELL